ncbi:uncharacterized protein BDW70DRAFT_114151 [Aspergillus foveolatus]|uniref:uncharacterized protein n=1 Tax=Aspergillus foveolatus TaxID=210207 RepID=UPI003CCCA11A
MANSTAAPQIPQHVSALLSHLTSRPGVQSTLILSRKDGSIIQTTGLLAPPKRTPVTSGASTPAPTSGTESAPTDTPTDTVTDTGTPSSPPTEAETQQLQPSSTTSAQTHTQSQPQAQSKPYQPTQAEALAAQIFSFVSAASNLSLSLSNPPGEDANGNSVLESGLVNGNGSGRDEGEADGSEGQDDDEVKLLRLRTKKHEVVIVPDRKYLLCVVQDATPSAAGSGGGGSGSSGLGTRRLSR